MKRTQTFHLGHGTLTLPNGVEYPCTELVITQEHPELTDGDGNTIHLGSPTTHIELRSDDGPEPKPA